ncbi:hypothetical protein BS47DRAFT_1394444 [Hydnum rufescens UP504]|uniref:Uncharacterized protein n=1 Tax=Hydnum rufescens UP504 TaxID=1448309 RepID=A0A9P6DV02_9AGAM|nr:hypothetical protein BS47DRAFT_1394444 [Hydnum rufescens UP504]
MQHHRKSHLLYNSEQRLRPSFPIQVYFEAVGAYTLTLPNVRHLEDLLAQAKAKGKDVGLVVVSDMGLIFFHHSDQGPFIAIGNQGVRRIEASRMISSLSNGWPPRTSTAKAVICTSVVFHPWKAGTLIVSSQLRWWSRSLEELARPQRWNRALTDPSAWCVRGSVENAQCFLKKYRDSHAIFNDDIQGAGVDALAALSAAIGVAKTKLWDECTMIYGGSHSNRYLRFHYSNGPTPGLGEHLRVSKASSERFWLINKRGLITEPLHAQAKVFAEVWMTLSTLVKPTFPFLIGPLTQAVSFTKELRGIHPKDANGWNREKALLGNTSPFDPVHMRNGKFCGLVKCIDISRIRARSAVHPTVDIQDFHLEIGRIMTQDMIVVGVKVIAE